MVAKRFYIPIPPFSPFGQFGKIWKFGYASLRPPRYSGAIMFYRSLARPLLFSCDPEWIHHTSLAMMTRTPLGSLLAPFAQKEFPSLEKHLFGCTFPNPIGLAAGFDKNAEGLNVWPQLGFGFMELGTITPRPQPGNPKPRVFRLPAEQGLINRLGFPNVGMEVVARRLEKIKAEGRWPSNTPVGLNLGKNKDNAAGRGRARLRHLLPPPARLGDYFVVNVSSPNTPACANSKAARFSIPS